MEPSSRDIAEKLIYGILALVLFWMYSATPDSKGNVLACTGTTLVGYMLRGEKPKREENNESSRRG